MSSHPNLTEIRDNSTRLVLVVAAALIDTQGRVLLAQRPPGKAMAGLWEFPGGKVEPGERPEQALIRELNEELGVRTAVTDLHPVGFASHGYDSFHLLMPLWAARHWTGDVTALEAADLVWAGADELRQFPMPAADLPLVEALVRQGWVK
jgi:8-oxo-dGTP diphosphatase